MDRKALSICAAATASLGLFCAGCGSDSIQPATSARKDSPAVAPAPQAVVVSSTSDFYQSRAERMAPFHVEHDPVMEVASEPAAETVATSDFDAYEAAPYEPLEVEAASDDGLAGARYEAQPLEPTPAEDEPIATAGFQPTPAHVPTPAMVGEPTPAIDSNEEPAAGQTEIRFAISGSKSDDDPTAPAMKLEVSESGSTVTEAPARPIADLNTPATAKPRTAMTPAASDEDATHVTRGLTPLVVMPRKSPTVDAAPTPTPAVKEVAATPVEPENPSTAVLKSEPAPAAEPVAEVPQTVKTEPTPAAEPMGAAPQMVPTEPTPAAPPQVVEQSPVAVQPAPMAVQPAPIAAQPAPTAMQPAPVQPAPLPPAPPIAARPPAPPAPPVAQQPAYAPPVPAALPAIVPRSPAMTATLAQVDERVRHAIQLAEKGALFASRKEFTTAITLLAQANDMEHNTLLHSKAAAAGFRAIEEASNFSASGLAHVEVGRVVAGHQTPVLKQVDTSNMPPALAAQHYYGYAKEQFVNAVGPGPVGSIALYGLAKIIVAGAGRNASQLEYSGPAIALYQAAVVCEPQNFRAAHELGVLLASSGQLELARELLLGSTMNTTQPTMWKNLAVVQSRLGDQHAAAAAHRQAQILEQTHPESKAPPVQWVDPATFASMTPSHDPNAPSVAVQPAPGAAPQMQPPPPPPVAPGKQHPSTARTRGDRFNPLNLRR